MRGKRLVWALVFAAASIVYSGNIDAIEAAPANSAAQDKQADKAHGHEKQRADRTPPYYENIDDVKEVPKTLSPDRFDDPATKLAYQVAQDDAKLLLQLPCFCPCDRPEIGHRSLLDCFVDTHAAGCDICKSEALKAARLRKEGWSVEKIRDKLVGDYATAHRGH
ncbi:MAG TPA: CYCXC family (seleno)protein [Blastocatellia bacterium]|nr:CYCXC family (seleno)protein [Blastocatellia bacterium]